MAFWPLRFAGGVLTGIGFFQLYDGLIQRKLLGLRQIRYEVDLAPYDLTWNIVAAVLLMIGVAVIIRTFGEIVLCEAHFDELEAEYCQNWHALGRWYPWRAWDSDRSAAHRRRVRSQHAIRHDQGAREAPRRRPAAPAPN